MIVKSPVVCVAVPSHNETNIDPKCRVIAEILSLLDPVSGGEKVEITWHPTEHDSDGEYHIQFNRVQTFDSEFGFDEECWSLMRFPTYIDPKTGVDLRA